VGVRRLGEQLSIRTWRHEKKIVADVFPAYDDDGGLPRTDADPRLDPAFPRKNTAERWSRDIRPHDHQYPSAQCSSMWMKFWP
jgi:hypothetical protein